MKCKEVYSCVLSQAEQRAANFLLDSLPIEEREGLVDWFEQYPTPYRELPDGFTELNASISLSVTEGLGV